MKTFELVVLFEFLKDLERVNLVIAILTTLDIVVESNINIR